MDEISRAIFRLSFGVLTFAVRGNQDSVVQQQIETIGLRQWLSFVALWTAETISADLSGLHDFIAPARGMYLRPLAAKLAVPTPIYLF